MTKKIKISLSVALFLIPVISLGAGGKEASFSPHVGSKGEISLPADFAAKWTHLGTWVVTSTAAAGPETSKMSPGTGLHQAYTQPESLRAYEKTGKWPDGTVIVQEVRAMQWDDLPTGHVIYAGDASEWFVMVRDGQGRFKENPNWGDGWGWALFRAADPGKNVSTNYVQDCRGCHEVARETDWVFSQGYPALR